MGFWSALGKTILVGAVVVGTAAVVIAVLSYEKFMQWFQQRQSLLQSDRSLIMYSLKQNLANGNVKVVQGVYNTCLEQNIDAQITETHRLDSRIANAHNQEGIAIWA